MKWERIILGTGKKNINIVWKYKRVINTGKRDINRGMLEL